MKILGISAYYHDSAAALLSEGELIAAAQEERFTRKKHDAHFPNHAIEYCLREGGISLRDVDFIAFYDKPLVKFERLLETYLGFAPKGFLSFKSAIPVWIRDKLFQKRNLLQEFKKTDPGFEGKEKLLFSEHHLSHAASAFFPSPFGDAVVLTIDGVGEWSTTSVSIGKQNTLEVVKELKFPHSLGLLYSAFTQYLGFKVNSGEYKIMGLAPYGTPKYTQNVFEHLMDLKEDGTFRLSQEYFDYCTGLKMVNHNFENLFGAPTRKAGEPLEQRHMDLAASIQAVTEEVVLRLTRNLAAETGLSNLCLAGGVALNCVANGKILRDGKFKKIWIQPAAGDAGGSVGAAYVAHYLYAKQPRVPAPKSGADQMKGSFLGPSFTQEEIEMSLQKAGARFARLNDQEVIERSASDLANGKALGWFQGRMEFGPRSLGARSILADARSPKMQSNLNLKIKFRESFRPFAPAVLREKVEEWFELDQDSPYMLLVADVAKNKRREMTAEERALFGIEKLNVPRSSIPAVTHVDYSARIQTVHSETHPRFHALLTSFGSKTGSPVLVNTSFNVRGEPIVCTPEDAFRCFMGNGLDTLVVGNCYLEKTEQDPALLRSYENQFELD